MDKCDEVKLENDWCEKSKAQKQTEASVSAYFSKQQQSWWPDEGVVWAVRVWVWLPFLTHFILISGLCCTLLFQHLQQKGTDTWLWVHGHAFKVTECTWGGTLRSMLSPRAEAYEYSANLHSTDAAEHQPYRMLSPLSPYNTHLLFLWAGFRNKCYEGSCGTVQTGCKLNREMAKSWKIFLGV